MEYDAFMEIRFTVEDIDLMLQGLEALPEKGAVAEMAMHMLKVMGEKDPAKISRLQKEEKADMRELDRRVKNSQDDITIAKAKLIQLRRLLLTESAVKEARKNA